MAKAGYAATTEAAVALAAATAKSILGFRAHANSAIQLTSFDVGFDGVTASAVPVLVELCTCTFATNAPGTNSTSVTPVQVYGRVLTSGMTAARNWTTEPTVLTVIDSWLVPADKGKERFQFPLGTEPDTALNEAFVIRCTAPAVVNVRAVMRVERI